MAEELGIKINELGAAQIILGTEFVPIDNGVDTLKATLNQVKEHAIGDNDISALGDGSVTGAILNVKSTSETADSNIAETMAQNGAHNLLNHDIVSQALSGLTVTVTDDKRITVSGAANGAGYLVSSYLITGIKAGVNYKFGGFPTDLAEYSAYLERADGGSSVSLGDFVGANTTYRLVVFFSGSFTTGGNPITFKPMITLASDPSNEYAAPAMTNRELTEKVSNRGLHIPSSADSFAGAVSSMFSAVIPLLTNVGDIADGCLEAINYDYFDFTVVKISSTIYRATINQGTRLVTSVYSNGTITSYKYDGTQI